MCRSLFKLVFTFPSDKYPEVELLDHMVVLPKIFGGTSILFSIVAALICILTNSAQGFPLMLFLIIGLGVWVWGERTIKVKCHPHHITSKVHTVNMVYH